MPLVHETPNKNSFPIFQCNVREWGVLLQNEGANSFEFANSVELKTRTMLIFYSNNTQECAWINYKTQVKLFIDTRLITIENLSVTCHSFNNKKPIKTSIF